jgi:hypothetical protein
VVIRTGKQMVVILVGKQTTYNRSEILEQIGARTFIGYSMVVDQKNIGTP